MPTVDIRQSTGLITTTGWPRALWVTGTVLLVTMVVHIAVLVITGDPVSGSGSAPASWSCLWAA